MNLPLFDHYPELRKSVPHKVLATLPTPVQHLEDTGAAWIKRDDLTNEEYGGNKIRKLEFILADAIDQNKKRIVTFGAIGTNHGVATSMLCREVGLACTVYLFDQPLSGTVRQNLRLMQYYGADLIYCGSLSATVARYYLNFSRLNKTSYFLFAGGSNVAGTLGFVNAAFELKQQIDSGQLPEPRTIVCPVGSSATLAGLTIGCQLAGLRSEVKGIRVAPAYLGPFPACTTGSVQSLMTRTQDYLARYGVGVDSNWKRPHLDDSYYGDGYGVATQAGQHAQLAMQKQGIVVEQTYTAKAVAAFYDELAKGGGECLYWHTFNSQDMHQQMEQAVVSKMPEAVQGFVTG